MCCLIAVEPTASAQSTGAFDPSRRSALREPVTLSSKDGLLEVALTAHQGEVTLDTVAKPVRNFLVFSYRRSFTARRPTAGWKATISTPRQLSRSTRAKGWSSGSATGSPG